MSKLKYLIVENVPDVCEGIIRRMKDYKNWEALPYCVSPFQAIEVINTKRPQLIFLDWSLNGGSAFEVLDHIAKTAGYDPFIIFNTAYQKNKPEIPQIVFNKYKIDKYIMKPIWEPLRIQLPEFISEAERKYLNKNKTERKCWLEDSTAKKILVNMDEIVCIRQHPVLARCRNLHLVNRSKEIAVPLQWQRFYEILRENSIDFFITKNRSHLVTRKYIESFEKPFISFQQFDKFKIEVVRENIRQFEKWLFKEE